MIKYKKVLHNVKELFPNLKKVIDTEKSIVFCIKVVGFIKKFFSQIFRDYSMN